MVTESMFKCLEPTVYTKNKIIKHWNLFHSLKIVISIRRKEMLTFITNLTYFILGYVKQMVENH